MQVGITRGFINHRLLNNDVKPSLSLSSLKEAFSIISRLEGRLLYKRFNEND